MAVLLAADKKLLPNLSVLTRNIAHPSILADFMLKELYGPFASVDDWASQHSGEVPPSFEPAEYFMRDQQRKYRRRLATSLRA